MRRLSIGDVRDHECSTPSSTLRSEPLLGGGFAGAVVAGGGCVGGSLPPDAERAVMATSRIRASLSCRRSFQVRFSDMVGSAARRGP
jgi:hypothetical protein